jgi:hypothetical protein
VTVGDSRRVDWELMPRVASPIHHANDYALAEIAYVLATAAATWIAPIDSVTDRVNGGSI